MGWLRDRRPVAPRPVRRGAQWPDDALAAAVAEAMEGRLRAAGTVLAECRADPELRAHRVDALARRLIGFGEEVAAIADAAADPDMLLLAGAILVHEAWAIRGTAVAPDAGEGRSPVFRAHLEAAVAPLRHSGELLPDDPLPWAQLDPVGRGLGFDRPAMDHIWSEVDTRCPLLVRASSSRVQTLAPKWSGGDDAPMVEFARAQTARAPKGHPLVAVLAEAVFEAAGHRGPRAGARLLTRSHPELAAASAKLLAAPIWQPMTTWAHNLFAAVFVAVDDRDPAAAHLRAMNDHLIPGVWSYIGGESKFHAAAAAYL